MRTKRRRLRNAVSCVVIVLLLSTLATGCTSKGNPKMNLEEAKAKALAAQAEASSYVPEEYVATSTTAETSSVLFPCEGGYYWPGQTTMTLEGGLDTDSVLSSIKAAWEGKPGWTVKEDTIEGGERRLDLTDKDGTRLFVTFLDGGATFDLASFSACFEFNGEPEYGVRY